MITYKWHFLYIKSRSSAPSKEALSTPLLGIQEFQGWWGGGAQMPPQGGGENSFYPNSLGQFYPDKQDPRAKAKIGFGPLNLAMNTSSSVLTCSIICYMEDNISKPPLEEPSNILFPNIHMLNNSAAK